MIAEGALGAATADVLDGHVVLVEKTEGVFPCAMAVIRVRPAAETCDVRSASVSAAPAETAAFSSSQGRWSIWPLRQEDAAYWNVLMTDVRNVREVVVLSSRARAERETLQDLAAAADRRRADLCLVYGVTCDDPHGYTMAALLMNAHDATQLAIIRACAGPGNFEPNAADQHRTDRRRQDPSFLCARRLEENVRDCLIEMIGHDEPSATQPSPWMGTGPEPNYPPVLILPR